MTNVPTSHTLNPIELYTMLHSSCHSACPGCNDISLAHVWKRQSKWHLAPKKTRPPGQLLHRVQY